MTDEEFLIQLRQAFTVEADKHVQAMTSGLLELEKAAEPNQRKELVETIFREAHSLKGAARAVTRTDIEAVCQALESVFAGWQRQKFSVAVETFDTLNRAIDLVARRLRVPDLHGSATEQSEVTSMVRQLGGMGSAGLSPQPVPASPSAPSPPPPPLPESGASPRTPPAAASVPTKRPEPEPAVMSAAPEAEALQLSETVRISMSKMDSLLRQAEELVAVKLTTAQHAMELRAFADVINEWRKQWTKVRELAPGDLAAQSPAALAKVGDFLKWNQDYMRSLEKRLDTLAKATARDARSVSGLIDDLLADAKRLVMLPFATLLDLFPKLVRDLARDQGKKVTLQLRGRDVEIDKRILQEMKDPLIHLVRNCIDHGLELPADRAAASKPPDGSLTLSITQLDASHVEIVVADDGAGIDVEKVKASAVRSGVLSEEAATRLDAQAALALIFRSGVSSSPIITEISGRGLGLAIVREKAERLGGQVSVETKPGQGTTFRIRLPVTLATFNGILVSAGGQSFVIPTAGVERIVRVGREEIQTVENRETIALNGHAVALVRLNEVLELPPRGPAKESRYTEVVVLGTGEKRVGFALDAVLGEQDVLVKTLGKPLLRVRNIAGATVLGSGTPVLILNTADLLKSAIRLAGSSPSRAAATETPTKARDRHVLVTDDSVTSRMLFKNILESAGYQVATALDGLDAWTLLKSGDFDLLLSDVEMPRMDGFDLTAKVRADARLAELPVVLVTALASREHQERGIDVGANAYIVKSGFDQSNLLDVIRRLI